ncbi:MAG: DNA polymerase IV [Kiritimatiellia bacterium]|jgi:DNA polymerase-4
MDSRRIILHVDMDAFFAAVEQRDRPGLRGKPVIVGAPPDQRGVVSTCSYEARAFGVRSAMPSREAYARCPHGIFLPPDMARYAAVSRQVMEILERFTPLVEQVSVDEAFLDVSGAGRLFGDGPEIARRIRAAIRDELRLTASIGVACNMFLAKLASELDKPDGLTVVPEGRAAIAAFLAPLPAGKIWGVGRVLQESLHRHGYRTIGDLQRADAVRLASQVGAHTAGHLLKLAFGDDPRELAPDTVEQSLSREHTFLRDVSDIARVRRALAALVDSVGARLRNDGRYAGLARIKLRWADFKTITRQCPLSPPACDDHSLREAAFALFDAEPKPKPVRLIGFGVAGLVDDRCEQMTLFDDPAPDRERQETLSHAIDDIRKRLGPDSLRRADTLPPSRDDPA